MIQHVFGSHVFYKKLVAAGADQHLAEVLSEGRLQLITTKVATKSDLETLRKDLTIRIGSMFIVVVGILLTALPLLLS